MAAKRKSKPKQTASREKAKSADPVVRADTEAFARFVARLEVVRIERPNATPEDRWATQLAYVKAALKNLLDPDKGLAVDVADSCVKALPRATEAGKKKVIRILKTRMKMVRDGLLEKLQPFVDGADTASVEISAEITRVLKEIQAHGAEHLKGYMGRMKAGSILPADKLTQDSLREVKRLYGEDKRIDGLAAPARSLLQKVKGNHVLAFLLGVDRTREAMRSRQGSDGARAPEKRPRRGKPDRSQPYYTKRMLAVACTPPHRRWQKLKKEWDDLDEAKQGRFYPPTRERFPKKHQQWLWFPESEIPAFLALAVEYGTILPEQRDEALRNLPDI
jgi:hypothetical protein